jgi:hypothetical protein
MAPFWTMAQHRKTDISLKGPMFSINQTLLIKGLFVYQVVQQLEELSHYWNNLGVSRPAHKF